MHECVRAAGRRREATSSVRLVLLHERLRALQQRLAVVPGCRPQDGLDGKLLAAPVPQPQLAVARRLLALPLLGGTLLLAVMVYGLSAIKHRWLGPNPRFQLHSESPEA